MNGECQATHEEICNSALEHYEQISKECCHWCSTVPAAIKFYKEYGEVMRKNDWLISLIVKLKNMQL